MGWGVNLSMLCDAGDFEWPGLGWDHLEVSSLPSLVPRLG